MSRRGLVYSSERSELLRTLIISIVLVVVFLAFIFGFWGEIYPFSDVAEFISNINPILLDASEVILLILTYAFSLIFVAMIREWTREVAGWVEVIGLGIIVVTLAGVLFSWIHALTTFAGCALFVTYLYFIQKEE